jgi:hypothetical protein
MKTTILTLTTAILLCACSVSARVVTLTVKPPTKTSDQVTVGSNEVARVLFSNVTSLSALRVQKDGFGFFVSAQSGVYTAGTGLVVAGPADITLSQDGICSIEITPESFPPDKTLIIPEGTSAVVSLECSTNLVSWTNIWTGSFSNAPTHKFFRLKAERSQ